MPAARFANSAAVFVIAMAADLHAQSNDLESELSQCLSFSGAVERLSRYDVWRGTPRHQRTGRA